MTTTPQSHSRSVGRPWAAIDIPFSQAGTAGAQHGDANPLVQLSRSDVPALILRRALKPAACRALIQRFADKGLLPADFSPYVKQELAPAPARSSSGAKWVSFTDGQEHILRERLDVGTALGNLGTDPERFFADAAETHALYATLFDGLGYNPIDLMYGALADLSGRTKQVVTAYEQTAAGKQEGDRLQYGPAIFRSHLPEFGYSPHIDSVRHREKRNGYEISRFATQFGGILLLQAPERIALSGEAKTPGYTPLSDSYHDTIMYKAPCTEPAVRKFIEAAPDGQVAGLLDTMAFRQFVEQNTIASFPVDLNTGDIYFFKSDSIHEVPGFGGRLARMTMATFIGYSEEDGQIMVWS